MNGKRVDVGWIGEHQNLEVLAEHRRLFRLRHARAPLGERLAWIGAQPQRGHANQQQRRHAFAQRGGRQSRDMPAEGEAAEP